MTTQTTSPEKQTSKKRLTGAAAMGAGPGRPKGTPNKATTEFRQTITALLEKNAANVDLWLQRVAEGDGENVKPDPGRALDLMTRDPEVHRFIVAVALSHRRTLDIRRIISWDQQWSAASAWQPVPYRGTSRHRDHVHLSIGCDL